MKVQNLIHIVIGIVCIGLLPGAKAVVPPPDGGNTAEGQNPVPSASPFEVGADTHVTWADSHAALQFANRSEVPEIETVSSAPATRSSFMASWANVAGATGYLLDVSTSDSFSDYVDGYHDLDVGNVKGRVVTGLTPGTTYYYRVRPYTASDTAIGPGNDLEAMTATTVPTAGLIIHATLDSSITGNPNAAAIEAMINRAISIYESLFSDPVTIQILFRYAATAPDGTPLQALAVSNSLVYLIPWTMFINTLRADGRTSNDFLANLSLPNTALSANIGSHSANGRAVGLDTPRAMFANGTVGSGGPYDGIVTLNSSQPLQFTRPTSASNYDAQQATEHEIDEVMGLGSHANISNLRAQDLFSWSSVGHRNISSSGTRYFSINGGVANIVNFNQNPLGDFGDWLSTGCPPAHPYVQNAFGCTGESSDVTVTSPEGINLDVIGYDLVNAVVTTKAASNITSSSATLNATVDPNGLTTTVHFEYGITINYGHTTANRNYSGNTTQNVSANITGLTPNTTYHFRLVGTNNGGTSVGSDGTFTTSSVTGPPVAATTAATNVASFSAKLNGSVNPHGLATSVYFQYGTTTSYGLTTAPQSHTGNTSLNISANISGLTASTTYHFRIVATNNSGTRYGSDKTFSTLIAPPAVTTYLATNRTISSATLNGSLDPQGLTTSVYFQYGTTTSYGHTTPMQSQNGNTFRNIAANISDLATHTIYHFRIVATNSAGTGYGSDRTFTTLTAPPVVTTNPATNVTSSSAKLNGSLDPHGLTTSVYFQYGTTTSYGHSTPTQSQNGNTFRNIAANISGLATHTIYHFRIVATNSGGTKHGSDKTFTTLTSSGPTPTPTATPTPTPTPIATATASPTATATATPTATPTTTATPTVTPASCVPGTWSTSSTGPPARYRAGGCTDGTNVYVYGGGNSTGDYYNDLWRWNPNTQTWTQLANMPTAKQNIQGAYWNGKIYVPGGFNGAHITENAIYNIATNTWSTGAPLPWQQSGQQVAFNNQIYNFGGNPTEQSTVTVYDIATNTWSTRLPMPIGITYGRATVAGDFAYYVGGINNGMAVNTVYRYDFAANNWDTMAPLQTARTSEELMTSPDNTKLIAVMGGDQNIFTGVPLPVSVELYDIASNTWSYGSPVVTKAAAPSGGLAGGKAMVEGGLDGTTYYDTVQVSLVPCGGATLTRTPTATATATATPTPRPTSTPRPSADTEAASDCCTSALAARISLEVTSQ